jgi:hypothetical protein
LYTPPPSQCKRGYTRQALPHGTYTRHCTRCCYHLGTKDLVCGACRCGSAYRRSGKACKGPWRFKVPPTCRHVAYNLNSNKLVCTAGSGYGDGKGDGAYSG